MTRTLRDHPGMKHATDILAENIETLAKHHGLRSDDAIWKRCSISQKTAWRIRHREQAVTLDKLDSIAEGFGGLGHAADTSA